MLGVSVRDGVNVGVGVGEAVRVAVAVAVGVAVKLAVGVSVTDGVALGVKVRVKVGVLVKDARAIKVKVACAVRFAETMRVPVPSIDGVKVSVGTVGAAVVGNLVGITAVGGTGVTDGGGSVALAVRVDVGVLVGVSFAFTNGAKVVGF